MTVLSIIATVAVVVGAIGSLVLAVRSNWRAGAFKASEDTNSALAEMNKAFKEQIALLKEENSELRAHVNVLQNELNVLRDLVTQAAPLREVAEWARRTSEASASKREQEHLENSVAFARLEGVLARVERYLKDYSTVVARLEERLNAAFRTRANDTESGTLDS